MRSFLLAVLTAVYLCLPSGSIAQVPWVPTGYPGAAFINGFITQVEADADGNIYALTDDGQLVATSDRGLTWTLYTNPKLIGSSGFEFFGGKFYVNAISGLHVSTDLTNWEEIDLPGPRFSSLNSEKGVLLAKGPQTYYMMEGGSDFIPIPDSLTNSLGSLAMNGKSELRYLSHQGYWKSAIGSTTWVRISDGIESGLTLVDLVAIKDSLYVGVSDEDSKPHLYATALDAIAKRPDLREVLIEGDYGFTEMFTTADSVMVALRKSKDNLFYEIHFSRDRTRLSPPLQMPGYMIDLSIINGKYYVTDGTDVYESTDYSQNWKRLSARLGPNVAKHLLALPDNKMIAATSRGFIMLSNDGGASWTIQKDLEVEPTMLAYTPNKTLLVGIPGQLLASRDLGKTFAGSTGFEERTPLSFAAGKNGKIFLGTDSGMYFSTDDGASWIMPESFNMPIVSIDNFLPAVYSIAVDRQNDFLFLGTRRGVILTPDEGAKYINGWIGGLPMYAVLVDKGQAFAGGEAVSSSDVNDRNFYFTTIIPEDPDVMEWYGTDFAYEDYYMDKLMMNSRGQIISGVLFSADGGRSWEIGSIEGKGSPSRVDAQAIDANDIAYISVGDMVYKSAGPKLAVSIRPESEARMTVYPNPASHMIQFAQGLEGDVIMYNMLGESVLTSTLDGSRSIDIRHLPAGSYICQLTSPSNVLRVPFVVVR